ncbi:MAG: response regulator [Gemmatimonadetes bacterium]|nr:response regulator [Gemmatimonadota bacterium]
MTDRTGRARRPPLTLIANSQEWHSRSLESILGPHGYAVLRAYTGKQAIERARSSRPDLIILDTDLPDRDGFDVCRELRTEAIVSPATPILITSPGHSSRQKRLEALKAGAWDFIGSALDGEELPLRLDAYTRAKQEVDHAREESLLDEVTGLYNIRGLARRARELGSQAFRHREPFACIVLTPMLGESAAADDAEATSAELLASLTKVLRDSGRSCDAIGMLGPGEFAVVAHDTDEAGAIRLAQRLAQAAGSLGSEPRIRMAAGYDAVPDYHEAPIEPSDMLMRASMAMRMSRSDVPGADFLTIRKFEGQLS